MRKAKPSRMSFPTATLGAFAPTITDVTASRDSNQAKAILAVLVSCASTCEDRPLPKTRTILITGSTGGLGRRVAEKLCARDVHVIVHGRDAARGRDVVRTIEKAGGSASYLGGDLSSIIAAEGLADAVLAAHGQLDVLVNNAGMALVGGPRRESPDRIELHFATNYLASFILTRRLMPILGRAGPSRIINVVSAAQSPIDFADLMLERRYDGTRAYGQSKLAQVMLIFDTANEADGAVSATCLHPASYMDTGMIQTAGLSPMNSVETGATAVLALINGHAPSGPPARYYDGLREARAHPQAYDEDARKSLKRISLELLGGDA